MERASRGEVSIPPEATRDFADSCTESVLTQLNKLKEYKIRMSGLGRPICQQLLERQGLKQETEYNLLFRFLFGDLVESVAVLILEQAGVDIVAKQKAVKLNIDGVETRIYKAVLTNGDTLVNRLKNPRNRAYIDFDFRCYTPFARAVDTTEQFTENFTSSTRDSIFENTGTAPTFTNLIFFINSASNLTQIQIENLTTGQTLQINAGTTFNAGQVLIVDGDVLTIELADFFAIALNIKCVFYFVNCKT